MRRAIRATGWTSSAVLWFLYLLELQDWIGVLWGAVAAVFLFPGAVLWPAVNWFVHDELWPSGVYLAAFAAWFACVAIDRLITRSVWRRLYVADNQEEAEELFGTLMIGRSNEDN